METEQAKYEYYQTILRYLESIKGSFINRDQYIDFVEKLSLNIERVPEPSMEQLDHFLTAVAEVIFDSLREYFDVTIEREHNGERHSNNQITTKIKPELVPQLRKFTELTRGLQFIENYLSVEDNQLYMEFKGIVQSYFLPQSILESANGERTISTNALEKTDSSSYEYFYIENGYSSTRMNQLVGLVSNEVERTKTILELIDPLTVARQAYDEKIKASLQREHIRFGTAYLKEILSRIAIPVSLIEDEALRQLCIDNGKEMFIRRPTMEDFLFHGASVHVYSSHEIEDDASYTAKPVLISDEFPSDTEEQKYLGVGQYTNYDAQSRRSLGGNNPYVINNNIFVKADYDEFFAVLPMAIISEIESCESMQQDINSEEKPTVLAIPSKTILDTLNLIRADIKKPEDILEHFIQVPSILEKIKRKTETLLQNFSESDDLFARNNPPWTLSFAWARKDFPSDLRFYSEVHPNGYLLVKHESNWETIHFYRSGEVRSRRFGSIDGAMDYFQIADELVSYYLYEDIRFGQKNPEVKYYLSDQNEMEEIGA